MERVNNLLVDLDGIIVSAFVADQGFMYEELRAGYLALQAAYDKLETEHLSRRLLTPTASD